MRTINTAIALCAIAVAAGCTNANNAQRSSAPGIAAEAQPVAHWERDETGITVIPVAEGAAPVRIEPVSPQIIRVLADPDGDFARDDSLMIVASAPFDAFTVEEVQDAVLVTTSALTARVDRSTGQVSFLEADGTPILSEHGGRSFSSFTLDDKNFYAIQQDFDADVSEGFYGLGQQQMGQMNYNGENVELAQHNISIAMPFVVSTGDYGILWDQSSITRFGDPRPWGGLDDTLIVRGEDGSEGGLTGRYYLDGEVVAETREGDPDYEYLPADQFATGQSVRDVFPAPLGTQSPDKVVWTGSIEAETAGLHKFQVYASSYITVTVDGETVVDRWRQNWNPYQFNFELEMTPGEAKDVRVEWAANDGYFRVRHLGPRTDADPRQLTLSSEVAQLMDYYFIHGETGDDVIAGYRDLTGKAVLLPRWAYGFWQSRQRYTNQQELIDVLAEYRAREIPIDNIVLDWFYWPEDSWGSHEFDAERFPDPAGMVDQVHAMDAQIMISVWPKFYPTTENYKALDAAGCIYRGNIERGALDWVGPGYLNAFVDPYSETCRELFWDQMQSELDTKEFDAWWMDATEPDMHSNVSHPDHQFRMGPTAMGPAAQYYNSFVLMNSRAVYEGERSGADPD
ncbi:MAG: TIM-barrel domain-containing protein, partial [Henriciella sp.]|uniref:TIM-barrel domain-containing protein n=1 Tax=Henriciella sp. TaxID=1968823 RepID=UPI003C764812